MVEQDKLDSWDAFSGNFLKADDVDSEEDGYVVIKVETHEENGQVSPRLTLERNEVKKLFDLNKTNVKYAKEQDIGSPNELLSCIVYFKKVKATNPTTKQEVDSLRIAKVEKVK